MAKLQFRRGTFQNDLYTSEPFFNDDDLTLYIGGTTMGSYIRIPKLDISNNGSFSITGDITASNMHLDNGLSIDGSVVINGSLIVGGNDVSSGSLSALLSGSLIPSTGSSFDVGSSFNRWKTIYADNAVITNITASSVEYINVNNKPTLVSGSSQINHDSASGFVPSEHIDHTNVSISAGKGLYGGGYITSTRTLTLDTASVHFTDPIYNVINIKGLISGSGQMTGSLDNRYMLSGSQISGSGTGTGYPYSLLYSTYNDFQTAITDINSKINNDGIYRTLFIDKNVDMTLNSPSTITVPNTISIKILPGFKFITPDVSRDIISGSNPISGSVSDNYVQLQFNGEFDAPKDKTIFVGDGLVWFGDSSLEKIYARWWGLFAGGTSPSVQSQNVKALQMAINSVVLDKSNRATSTIRLPNGNLYLNSPVVAFACSMDSHPFLTGRRNDGNVTSTILHIEGTERIKHEVNFGQTSNIYYTAKWGAPLMLQGLRNSSVKKIRWQGSNNPNARDSEWVPVGLDGNIPFLKVALRPDNFDSKDINNIAWIESDVTWGSYQPYSAIITDPFRIYKSSGEAGYTIDKVPESTLDLYYGNSTQAHQNSWDVVLENMHFEQYVEGIMNTLTGQQGDTYVYRDLMFQNIPVGISTKQDQSRDCNAYEIMGYSNVWALFDTRLHGSGILPQIHSAHSAGGMKYFHYGSRGDGSANFNNLFGELVYAMGATAYDYEYYQGDGISSVTNSDRMAQLFPASIMNSTVKIGGISPYTTADGDCYLFRPPTIKGFNIYNSMIMPYVSSTQLLSNFQAYQDCNIYGMVTSNTSNHGIIDYGMVSKVPHSTIHLDNNTGPTYPTDTYIQPLGGGNYNSGKHMSYRLDMFDVKTFDKVERRRFDLYSTNDTIKVYPDRGFVDLTKSGTDLKYGDLLILSPPSSADKNMLGTVISNDGIQIRIANFSKKEMTYLTARMDGSNIINDLKVYKISATSQHLPFLSSIFNGSTSLSINYTAAFNQPPVSGLGQPVVGDLLKLPDGKDYRVIAKSSNTLTLNTSYQGNSFTNKWIEPYFPSFETFGFMDSSPNGGRFLWSSYFYKGEKYEYWKDGSVKQDGYVICTKEGDYYSTESGSISAPYKANFLRYDSNGNLIEYISGETTVYPLSTQRIPFYKSGSTAQRPDSLNIPNEVIPRSYLYRNTDTSTNQLWDGSTFINTSTAASGSLSNISPFGRLDIKKKQGNTDNTQLEIGDRVVNSNLSGSIFLIYGEWVSGDPMLTGSYDSGSIDYYNPSETF